MDDTPEDLSIIHGLEDLGEEILKSPNCTAVHLVEIIVRPIDARFFKRRRARQPLFPGRVPSGDCLKCVQSPGKPAHKEQKNEFSSAIPSKLSWVAAPASTDGRDGLADIQCGFLRRCHPLDGRGLAYAKELGIALFRLRSFQMRT